LASGDPVLVVADILPPASLFAVLTRRVGGSTPAEGQNVWAFDAGVPWYLDFLCRLQGYGNGGLTFTLPWTAATATTGATRWGIAIHRLAAGVDDVDVAHTYVYTALDVSAPGTAGFMTYSTLALTHGAAMDGWLNLESALVRVRREADHANDTMAGNAELWSTFGAVET
jgi:hypothetical protein